jgi:IS30 family transposase
MKYLQTRRLPAGSSKKQVKRLEKASQTFKVDKEILYLKKPNDEKFILIYPKPEERKDIVEKQHLIGHFKAETVYKALKSQYYWKNMRDDIEHIVKACDICKRHDKHRIVNHPALALPVCNVFDRVGMDLVFGLPEDNAEGYKGILVITEYLTKFPYAVPIKSKTAGEIAKHFMDYVCLFGPPKSIITDQGLEFNNYFLRALLEAQGIEHRVTSAYNPRTNGQTERFNQILVNILRKYSEDNTSDWHRWIPFVLYSYRARIHSTTGFTPFELMFGRQINAFK